MAHAAESTHWYRAENGAPCYEVMGANGKMRPTTLRDARKLNLVPSVTTIIRCADRPGLVNWQIDQAILAALTLPRKDEEPEPMWLARVKQDAREQARKAAERGTAIHAAIQGHYEGKPPSEEMWPFVQGAVKALSCWGHGYIAERSFAHPMGFGGKVDLHSLEASCVADVKSKEFGPEDVDDLRIWDEQPQQLSAYARGLGVAWPPRAAIVYVSSTHPGLARLVEVTPDELNRGWECFKALLSYWQAKNKYSPMPERRAA